MTPHHMNIRSEAIQRHLSQIVESATRMPGMSSERTTGAKSAVVQERLADACDDLAVQVLLELFR